MVNPPQMFKVLLIDAKTGGKKVLLPCERTAEEVAHLKENYEIVEAIPVVHEENNDSDEKVYRHAITALVKAHRVAKRRGDVGLAGRAEEAMAALLGGEREQASINRLKVRGGRAEEETQ